MDLGEYERSKLELAAILRNVAQHASRQGVNTHAGLRPLFERLASDRFNLTLLGRFSRGKTSLMNAMLGMDRLPTGVLPLTSVITTVTYGSEEKAVLYYHRSSLFMDAPLDQLAEYITERGNPGNRRGIRLADVKLPAELLRHGFSFVDTPGLGSAIAANTRTTEAFLPEADAIIVVTSHDSPLSGEEVEVLRRAAGRRCFVVVNKQDVVDDATRSRSLAHVRNELAGLGGGSEVAVFSVSARQALAGRLGQDAAAVQASGLLAFEAALISFLVNEQRHAFLLGMCGRIEALLRGPALAEPAARLSALRAAIGQAVGHTAPPLSTTAAAISPLLPACEICTGVADTMFRFMTTYQSQLYDDRSVQDDLAARGGLCRVHAAEFEAIAAAREVAAGLAPVLARQAHELRQVADAGASPAVAGAMVAGLLPNGRSCPGCAATREAEAREIRRLVAVVARQGANAVHQRSALCMPHLARLVGRVRDAQAAATLLRRQADLLERLGEDACRFVLKHDAIQRHAASTEELQAATRASRVLLEQRSAQHTAEAGIHDAGAAAPQGKAVSGGKP